MLVPSRQPRPVAVPPVLRFDPRADIRAMQRGHDGALVALVLAVAVVVSSLWLPSFGWASPAAASAFPLQQSAEGRGPRRLGGDVAARCAGQAWGAQDLSCIEAILRASGRPVPRHLRRVG